MEIYQKNIHMTGLGLRQRLSVGLQGDNQIKYGKDSPVYKFWWNKVQQAIKSARHCFYTNRASELAVRNPKKWWKQVKSLTGQDISSKRKWYYQFLSDISPDNPNLATEINNFFINITEHFEPLASVETPPPPISSICLVGGSVV